MLVLAGHANFRYSGLPMSAKRALFLFGLFATAPIYSQQSLFNVPSSEITQPAKSFFEEQVSYGAAIIQLNSTYCYGVGDGMEVGLDLFNLNLNTAPAGAFFLVNSTDPSQTLSPILLATFQKGFELHEKFKLGLGAQIGTNLSGALSDLHPLVFLFANTATHLPNDLARIYLGLFYGNAYYLGSVDMVDFMLGVEIPIFKETFHLVADYLHGQHNLGQAVVGFTYFASATTSLSLGWQIPNPGTPNTLGPALELTLLDL